MRIYFTIHTLSEYVDPLVILNGRMRTPSPGGWALRTCAEDADSGRTAFASEATASAITAHIGEK